MGGAGAGCCFNGADEIATLREINGPWFVPLTGLEEQFVRTIKRTVSLTVLANRGKGFASAPVHAEAALSPDCNELFFCPRASENYPLGHPPLPWRSSFYNLTLFVSMHPYHLTVPLFQASELSRTLIALRKKAGLTPQMLAKATNIPCSSLIELENGRRKPTLLILNRLTAALDCEDLSLRFPPVFAVTPSELRRPEAVHLRLLHLIEMVAEGNQRRFAIGAGLPEGSMSPLVNKRLPLTPGRQQQLLTALPTLSPAWLMRGEGEPFAPHPTPTFMAPPLRPKPAAPTPTCFLTVRYKNILVMPSLEPWDPSLPAKGAGPSKSELLSSLMQRVQLLAERECGMGPAQVVSVLRILKYVL